MSDPEPTAHAPHDSRTTTRLQEIALEYLHRYWHRLHPKDRLEFLTTGLTIEERQALVHLLEKDPQR